MSEPIMQKFYRLPNGTVGTVRIELDPDQGPHNPRENEECFAGLFTFERRYASPDKTIDVPEELDNAISQWRESNGIDAYRVARYARIFHTDSILFVGGVSRNDYDGTMSIDENPSDGAQYEGVVIVTANEMRRNLGMATDSTWPIDPDEARSLAAWEVKRYSEWASGEVYGYVAATPDDDSVMSCWGFIGPDEFDHMMSEGERYFASFIAGDDAGKVSALVEITEDEYQDAADQAVSVPLTYTPGPGSIAGRLTGDVVWTPEAGWNA